MDRERALLDELRDALSLLDKERERNARLEEELKEEVTDERETIVEYDRQIRELEERNARLEKALRIIARGANGAARTARAALESDEQN
jgi:transposase-like protein